MEMSATVTYPSFPQPHSLWMLVPAPSQSAAPPVQPTPPAPPVTPEPTRDTRPAFHLLKTPCGTWFTRFEGRPLTLPPWVGADVLAAIIERQHAHSICCREIRAAVTGVDPRESAGSCGEMADREYLNSIKQRIRELEEIIEEAIEFGDYSGQEAATLEREELLTHCRSVSKHNGDPREATAEERDRKWAYCGLRNITEWIHKQDPSFATYLQQQIKTGKRVQFRQRDHEVWVVEDRSTN